MPIRHTFENAKLWIDSKDVEDTAMDQIKATAGHPKLFKHLAVMPDVHMGIGCTIGSVIPIKEGIIPACVGVDIGCGMCAVQTNLKVTDVQPHFHDIHGGIVRSIPMGFSHRDQTQTKIAEEYLKSAGPDLKELIEFYGHKYPNKEIIPQLGTLGGGNHFIELQVDSEGNVWIMLHSGSRNIGNLIASTYIKKAKDWTNPSEDVPEDMEYLHVDSDEGQDYIDEMTFALQFAMHNRYLMMKCIQDELEHRCSTVEFEPIINIHHNYAAKENHFGEDVWVHRKGATKAVSDQLGIIPGSQGTASYIVRGKGNPESFMSCSHGAGRLMSRTAARGRMNRRTGEFKSEGRLTVDGFEKAMEGIFSRNIDRKHLDEAPGAYKDIDTVMANQTDLVEVVVKLKPIFNVKG